MAADRAINLALRVLGIGEVERDFRRVGDAGSKSFAEVRKATNGAALEVSDYTERLKRTAAMMRQMAANTPALSKGTPEQQRANRRDFILGGVQAEQDRILKGLPDATAGLDAGAAAAGRFGGSLGLVRAAAGAAALSFGTIALAITQSLEAFAEHEQSLATFNATLSLSGNRSTATTAQIRAMAMEIAAATGQTEAATLEAAAALAKIPGLAREGLQGALEAAAKLGAALGTDVASVVNDQVRPAFKALADRDMKALFTATEQLNPELRLTVLSLAEAGRTADAQQALIEGLARAAGDGPGGLTSAASELATSWRQLKESLGEDISGDAQNSMRTLAGMLDWLREKIRGVSTAYANMMNSDSGLVGAMKHGLVRMGIAPQQQRRIAAAPENPDPYGTGAFMNSVSSAVADARVQARWGASDRKAGKGRSRGGGGRSPADTAQREADQARAAADRIAQANEDVITSWAQRAAEVEAKVGLEGDALKAVEQQQEVEAAVRRINTDAIAREVEARQKAAAAAGQQFDAVRATAEATAEVNRQQGAVRDLAERYVAAEQAMAEFNQRQSDAKAVLEGLKTPMEKINDEVEHAIDLLRNHALTADQFNGRMKQLAEDMARAGIEADANKRLWVGFGDDVGRTLSDLVMRGGSARDVLQQLIQLPLERLLFKNIEQPIASAVDSLFGVNVEKNAAQIQQGWPSGAQALGAGASMLDGQGGPEAATALAAVGISGTSAAQALTRIATTLGEPVTTLGSQTDQAGQAMGKLVPLTGQFGGVMGQAIAMLSSAGGGGGGLLGSLLNIGGSLLGGGLGGGGASVAVAGRGAATSLDTIATASFPGFAIGTHDVPVGQPFWVGENGRELMERTRSGALRVHSNPQSRRMVEGGSGGITIVQHVSVPERADPRRTASGIARATQGSIARSARKGLAATGSY